VFERKIDDQALVKILLGPGVVCRDGVVVVTHALKQGSPGSLDDLALRFGCFYGYWYVVGRLGRILSAGGQAKVNAGK